MYADDLNLLINNNVLIIVNDVSADEVINILILLLRLIWFYHIYNMILNYEKNYWKTSRNK